MCCFSGPVKDVSATKIHARWLAAEGTHLRQAVVYQMNYKTAADLAMILPLPVAPGSGEKAVQFINLEKHKDLFERLHQCFPIPLSYSSRNSKSVPPPAAAAEKLEVVQVGSFEASFVPTVKDFARLDERFRLPAGTWDQLPQYAAYGFAVFKLKATATTVHPMAFSFPQAANTSRGLFFPTVHIHDGKVHKRADFDHTLYTQQSTVRPMNLMLWEESPGLASTVFKEDYKALVDLKQHIHRRRLTGKLTNEDTWA